MSFPDLVVHRKSVEGSQDSTKGDVPLPSLVASSSWNTTDCHETCSCKESDGTETAPNHQKLPVHNREEDNKSFLTNNDERNAAEVSPATPVLKEVSYPTLLSWPSGEAQKSNASIENISVHQDPSSVGEETNPNINVVKDNDNGVDDDDSGDKVFPSTEECGDNPNISCNATGAITDISNPDITISCEEEVLATQTRKRRKYRFQDNDSVSFEKTRFKDIIGHGTVKLRIDEVLLPLALPASIADTVLIGIRSLPASILLYGPPGCGKTQLARAIAGEARAAFISIAPSDILSKFVGESEASIRDVFKKAWACTAHLESKCAVVFFDEIDALGQSRADRGSGEGEGCSRRVLAELLMQFNSIADQNDRRSERHSSVEDDNDGASSQCSSSLVAGVRRVIIVAATNRPEDCDGALLRRFGIRLNVGPPTKRDRKKMLLHHLSDIENTVSQEHLNDIVNVTQGWSGSDIESMTREAAMAPVRECLRAAAVWRKRAANQQQCGGDVSGQEDPPAQPPDPDMEARNLLLSGFQKLRPVTIQDFERAVNFFLGGEEQQQRKASLGSRTKSSDKHYDSSSSEEG